MQGFGAVLVAGGSCVQQKGAVVLVYNLEKESLGDPGWRLFKGSSMARQTKVSAG